LIEDIALGDYKWGFTSDFESDNAPKGLSEDIVRFISKKKNEPEWMLEWRLKALRYWVSLKEEEPAWANIHHPRINFQDIIYYSAPKPRKVLNSLDELDPEIKATFDKLGIIFCSFSEAVQEHPELVKKYVGSVVPMTDNFYAALNSAVFTDGSFCYIPKDV